MPSSSSGSNSYRLPRFFWIVSLAVLLITVLPYLWAAQAWRGEEVFGGFLFNPIDGNTYLAKMRQGWEGSWSFHLAYTAEPGEGAYLFLYYLLLGQIARVSHLDLIVTFHLARVVGTILMLFSLWRFFAFSLKEERLVKIAFAVAVLGSGMGWIASMFGAFTADLWVAEAYPFLTAYANPHFPLTMAILLWVLTPFGERSWPHGSVTRALLTVLAGAGLGIVLPFGVVVASLVLAGLILWQFVESRKILKSVYALRLVWLLVGAGPILLYYLWVINTHPGLHAWNAQNLTPSPTPLDFAVAFLPGILFGIPGGIFVLRSRQEGMRVLLVWCVAGIALLYLPIGLQRRLMLGLMVPFAGLSSLGIQYLSRGQRRRQLILTTLLFLVAIPTNLIVLLAGIHGVQTRDSLLYVTQDEYRGFAWLADHTPEEALVLAAPETGLFIPAYSGRRVIYGHPFESLQAEEMESLVVRLFDGTASPEDRETLDEIDYIYWGPRESKLGDRINFENFEVAYQEGNVTILEKFR